MKEVSKIISDARSKQAIAEYKEEQEKKEK